MTMIVTEGLTRRFLDRVAVDRLSIAVRAGEVLGFLGPNGAGKTTTVRMLCALIAPSEGTAEVAGLRVGTDDDRIRRTVGILTETPGHYETLTVQQNLMLFARLYGIAHPEDRCEHHLRQVDLWERRGDIVGSLSKGMRQKLAIARTLVHEPRVLFLDEPTSGLDPEASQLVRESIAALKAEGRTIFLCTHNLDEADRLCDRVALFKTRLLAIDTPANLRRALFGRQVVFHLKEVREQHERAARELPYVKAVQTIERKLVIQVDDPDELNPGIVRALVDVGAEIRFIGEVRHSLEEVYMQLVGEAP